MPTKEEVRLPDSTSAVVWQQPVCVETGIGCALSVAIAPETLAVATAVAAATSSLRRKVRIIH